jgi:hypothetical protein
MKKQKAYLICYKTRNSVGHKIIYSKNIEVAYVEFTKNEQCAITNIINLTDL